MKAKVIGRKIHRSIEHTKKDTHIWSLISDKGRKKLNGERIIIAQMVAQKIGQSY